MTLKKPEKELPVFLKILDGRIYRAVEVAICHSQKNAMHSADAQPANCRR
jgi:hypothetical protein